MISISWENVTDLQKIPLCLKNMLEMFFNRFDPHFEPSIHAALGLAKQTLNYYYSATDQSDVYHIAISTYPSHSVSLYSTLLFQSYTPAISFSISRQLDGRTNGSKQQKNLQGKYLNKNMPGDPPRTTPRRTRT
jgi:hypothetical protein